MAVVMLILFVKIVMLCLIDFKLTFIKYLSMILSLCLQNNRTTVVVGYYKIIEQL